MVSTRFRTLVKEPQRGHEIELSASKFQINQPKPRKARIWRSSKSAAMGYFWTKTDRGKSWKRWSAEKETFGAKWGYYLMSGTNIPYLNPEKFIERNGYRIIELRMKRSAVKDAVETKIEETRTRGKRTAQEEKTQEHTPTILGIRVKNHKISERGADHQGSAQPQAPEIHKQRIDEEPEGLQFANDEFYTFGHTFENRGWIPSALSRKIDPNTVDFTSEEITNHIAIQVVFGMSALMIDEEEIRAPPKEQEITIAKQLAANARKETEEEPETTPVAEEKTAHQREARAQKMRRKREQRNIPLRLKVKRKLQENKLREQSAKENRRVRKNYLDTKKQQKRNSSAALLRRGVRVGVIRNQHLRLASAGVSLPPEKN